MTQRFPAILVLLLLSACVQTGSPRFKADLDEASRLNTQLGMSYLQQGNLEVSMGKFEKAIQQDADQAEAYWGLALVYARYQEFERASQYFDEALSRAPDHADILASHGEFLCQLGAADAAHAAFSKAVATPRYRTPEVAYTHAGSCYLKQGDPLRAEQQLRKALNYNPRYPRALLQLASLKVQSGEHVRARAFLQRLEAQGAYNAESLLLALRNEYALGDDAGVRRYAAMLKKQFPELASQIDLSNGKAW